MTATNEVIVDTLRTPFELSREFYLVGDKADYKVKLTQEPNRKIVVSARFTALIYSLFAWSNVGPMTVKFDEGEWNEALEYGAARCQSHYRALVVAKETVQAELDMGDDDLGDRDE